MAQGILLPFGGGAGGIACKIEAARAGDSLRLEFRWEDPAGAIDLLGAGARRREILGESARRSGLWENTCFEAYLLPESGSAYWELNISPRGEWGFYRFDSERAGMRDAAASSGVAFELRARPSGFAIEAELALPFPPSEKFRAGVCAVIARRDGALQYWSLAHTRQQPDFHAPDSFRLHL